MIIHYNNKTGDIYGTTNGRIHSKLEMKSTIRPEKIAEEDISSYIVPHKAKKKTVTVEGKKVKVGDGFRYDVDFDEFLYDMEKRKLKIFDFRIFEDMDENMVFDEAPEKKRPPISKEAQKNIDLEKAERERVKKGIKKPCVADLEVQILELGVELDKLKKAFEKSKRKTG